MAKAEIPTAALTPPDPEELEAVRRYAKKILGSIGDGSLMYDPAKAAIAAAAREEVHCLANLALAEEELKKDPDSESWKKRRTDYRHRLVVALRDQGRLYEALAYADTPSEKEKLLKGFQALERDDDDFICPDGCQDDISTVENLPREFTRWERVKADIPRVVDGLVQMVTLWQCRKCGDYNASRFTPPSRLRLEKAIAKAAPGTRDGDILPVVRKDANI